MEWESALVTLAREKGIDEAFVLPLLVALEPLEPLCSGPEDFGCFFPTLDACASLGKSRNLDKESVFLL